MNKNKLFNLKLKEQLVIIEDEHIIVRELDAGQSNEYEHSLYTMVGGKPVMKTENAEIKLIIISCYDEEGNKLFDMKELEQIKKMPAWIIDKLYGVAKKLNTPNKDEVRKN
jgi:hypothetical protein